MLSYESRLLVIEKILAILNPMKISSSVQWSWTSRNNWPEKGFQNDAITWCRYWTHLTANESVSSVLKPILSEVYCSGAPFWPNFIWPIRSWISGNKLNLFWGMLWFFPTHEPDIDRKFEWWKPENLGKLLGWESQPEMRFILDDLKYSTTRGYDSWSTTSSENACRNNFGAKVTGTKLFRHAFAVTWQRR